MKLVLLFVALASATFVTRESTVFYPACINTSVNIVVNVWACGEHSHYCSVDEKTVVMKYVRPIIIEIMPAYVSVSDVVNFQTQNTKYVDVIVTIDYTCYTYYDDHELLLLMLLL